MELNTVVLSLDTYDILKKKEIAYDDGFLKIISNAELSSRELVKEMLEELQKILKDSHEISCELHPVRAYSNRSAYYYFSIRSIKLNNKKGWRI